MIPRRRSTRRARIAVGSAASVGALLLALAVAIPALPERSQRLLCAAVRGICSVISPEVECAGIPPRPFEGQATPAEGFCPGKHSAINSACWVLAAARPPCPVGTWEHAGNCYSPLMLPGRRAPTPNAQEP